MFQNNYWSDIGDWSSFLLAHMASLVNDQRNYIYLPPELKQQHGDAFILADENDEDLASSLNDIVCHIQTLEDGNPPYVSDFDDACVWIRSIPDHFDKCMEYFSLVLCVITDNLLRSRYFADAALLSSLNQHEDAFIPVFANREECRRIRENHNFSERLPSLYRLIKPLYLDDQARNVEILKKLFNSHLKKKVSRIQHQKQQIQQALHEMQCPISNGTSQNPTSSQEFQYPHSESDGELFETDCPARSSLQKENIKSPIDLKSEIKAETEVSNGDSNGDKHVNASRLFFPLNLQNYKRVLIVGAAALAAYYMLRNGSK